MKKVGKPKVKTLGMGQDYVAKQMEGKADEYLPKHLADVESVMFIHEGECYLIINEEDVLLRPGDAYIIPPKIKHQFKGITDFKGIHFMPKDIKIEYFDD